MLFASFRTAQPAPVSHIKASMSPSMRSSIHTPRKSGRSTTASGLGPRTRGGVPSVGTLGILSSIANVGAGAAGGVGALPSMPRDASACDLATGLPAPGAGAGRPPSHVKNRRQVRPLKEVDSSTMVSPSKRLVQSGRALPFESRIAMCTAPSRHTGSTTQSPPGPCVRWLPAPTQKRIVNARGPAPSKAIVNSSPTCRMSCTCRPTP
mmetsp:Transcript_78616/g.227226  ORF Transcript_78616/g.227226 Transcript_78616/m.227226 type:complete len:208 (-) Transcript_78616:148-771(-)